MLATFPTISRIECIFHRLTVSTYLHKCRTSDKFYGGHLDQTYASILFFKAAYRDTPTFWD